MLRPVGRKLRLLYLGMAGEFSLIPLQALLSRPDDVEICGVVLPAADQGAAAGISRLPPPPPVSQLRLVNRYLHTSIKELAWENQFPCFELSRPGSPQALETIASLAPDLAVAVCFNQILPGELLAIPPFGFTNLHPSLLPAHRGPEPMFWVFRQGSGAGVTLHFMDQGIDSGDIIAQRPLTLPDGISGNEASRLAAAAGAQLLLAAVDSCRGGSLKGSPQPAGGGYQRSPEARDFQISLAWSARRAFNFMRGTAEWGMPYAVAVAGEQLRLSTAVSFSTKGSLTQRLTNSKGEVLLPFARGILTATVR